MASTNRTSLISSDKTCASTTQSPTSESFTSTQSSHTSHPSIATESVVFGLELDYGGIAQHMANSEEYAKYQSISSINNQDPQAAVLQWQASLLNPRISQQATRLWMCDQKAFHLMPGTILVNGVGVRSQTEAWFHLVLGRDVLDHDGQIITAEFLERSINPEMNVDPIILRQQLWKTLPPGAWWSTFHGPKQPGLDVDMISTYYSQRCDRSTKQEMEDSSLECFSSTSGAGVLFKASPRRDSMLDEAPPNNLSESTRRSSPAKNLAETTNGPQNLEDNEPMGGIETVNLHIAEDGDGDNSSSQ